MEKKIQTLASLSTHSFSAHLDEVLLRNGKVGKRIRVDHPEAAAIIPFISDNEIIMVRQFRYALGKETLEIPAGKMDPGEKPEECARRFRHSGAGLLDPLFRLRTGGPGGWLPESV